MRRRGIMLFELAVAATLLAVAVTACVKLVAFVALQHRSLAERQLATQEAANLMERLATVPLADLHTNNARNMPLSPEAARLEGVKADIDATDVEGPPRAVRIAVTIQWEGRDGRPLPPIRLVAWRYR